MEQVRERSRRDQELLDSGSINDPKQLQGLQHELGSLARRQGELEDVDQHLFRLVFIDGLRDFKQGLQLQFFPLVFVTIRLHVRGYCEPLSPFLWPNT